MTTVQGWNYKIPPQFLLEYSLDKFRVEIEDFVTNKHFVLERNVLIKDEKFKIAFLLKLRRISEFLDKHDNAAVSLGKYVICEFEDYDHWTARKIYENKIIPKGDKFESYIVCNGDECKLTYYRPAVKKAV